MDVVLVKPGTNPPALADALIGLRRDLPPAEATNLLAGLPKTVLTVATGAEADAARKSLSADGAEVSVRTVALGPEIERGWGTRLSVAHDYLYDVPLLLGTLRLGPDLANVGMRKPDRIWHLLHLYDPRLETSGSTMPRFPFLFQKHPRGSRPSPKALPIPGEEEIIPTPEAEALVAYLLSLRTEVPLFEAPGPQLMLPVGATNTTNAMISPSAGTNEVPAIAPSNQASPK